MKLVMIIGLVGSMLTHSVGVAENEHYISFTDGTGYYVEDEGLIHTGDMVLEVSDELFVICNNDGVGTAEVIDPLKKLKRKLPPYQDRQFPRNSNTLEGTRHYCITSKSNLARDGRF